MRMDYAIAPGPSLPGLLFEPGTSFEIAANSEVRLRVSVDAARLPAGFQSVADYVCIVDGDTLELLLNRTWRPALAITGQGGMPDLVQAGNVLRPKTSLKVSLRLPPTLDATNIDRRLKELFERDPPYGARISFEPEKGGTGWEAPKTDAWLEHARLASVRFNNGGSGSFVSPNGLLITNHHIAADALQKLSTPERDLFRD